jgi:hypothetical protein
MTFEHMQSIQADVKLLHAEVFVPAITAALGSARRPGVPAALAAAATVPGVAEAVACWSGGVGRPSGAASRVGLARRRERPPRTLELPEPAAPLARQ